VKNQFAHWPILINLLTKQNSGSWNYLDPIEFVNSLEENKGEDEEEEAEAADNLDRGGEWWKK
jgi:hypothetical protein